MFPVFEYRLLSEDIPDKHDAERTVGEYVDRSVMQFLTYVTLNAYILCSLAIPPIYAR
jgi:hypothetical protein